MRYARKLAPSVLDACWLLLCLLTMAGAHDTAQAQQSGTRCSRLAVSKSPSSKAKPQAGKAAGPARAGAASAASPASSASTSSSASTALPVSTAAPASTVAQTLRAQGTKHLVDASLPEDPALVAMLAPYRAKVDELETVIGRLEGTLVKGVVVGGSMGNFVTDAVREQAQRKLNKPLTLAVLNRDGLRKNTIAQGELRARDIYEVLPFENELVAVDLNGAQLRRFLETLMANRDLAQSGARITYQLNEQRKYDITSLKLIGANGAPEEIDPARVYTIVTVDFILNRGGAYSFLKEIKETRPLNLRIRDAVISHVKAATAAGRVIRAVDDERIKGPGMSEGEIT